LFFKTLHENEGFFCFYRCSVFTRFKTVQFAAFFFVMTKIRLKLNLIFRAKLREGLKRHSLLFSLKK